MFAPFLLQPCAFVSPWFKILRVELNPRSFAFIRSRIYAEVRCLYEMTLGERCILPMPDFAFSARTNTPCVGVAGLWTSPFRGACCAT